MSCASREHNIIKTNMVTALGSQLRGRPWETYSSDMRVKVSPTGLYTYPDVVVACGDVHFEDTQVDTLTNPTVIVEVLSPSTEAYDRGEKFAHYRRLPTLTDYLLISQERMRIEHFVRHGEQWLLTEISDPDGVVEIVSIGCRLALRSIYDRIEFPEAG